MIEAAVVGALTSATLGAGAVLWFLLVRPHEVLSMLQRDEEESTLWPEEEGPALRALRWGAGVVLVGLSFATGGALVFLSIT